MSQSFTYRFILVSLALLLSVSALNAQVLERHVFKIGLNKILNKQYFIGHEFSLFKGLSINTELGFLRKAYYLETIDVQYAIGDYRTDQTKSSSTIRYRTNAEEGFQINLEARYRPGQSLTEGLYIGIKTGYQKVDFGPLDVGLYRNQVLESAQYTKVIEESQQSWLIGGTLGFSFKLGSKITLDTNIFSGYVYIELIDPASPEFVPYTEPEHNIFLNNHLRPIDQFRIELNLYLGFQL